MILEIVPIRALEDSNERIALQPHVFLRVQECNFRNPPSKSDKPLGAVSPGSVHLQPGVLAVRLSDPGIEPIRVFLRFWIESA